MTMRINKAQQRALLKVYDRDRSVAATFLAFRRTARIHYVDCLMVPWKGMWLGIETDGHTHS